MKNNNMQNNLDASSLSVKSKCPNTSTITSITNKKENLDQTSNGCNKQGSNNKNIQLQDLSQIEAKINQSAFHYKGDYSPIEQRGKDKRTLSQYLENSQNVTTNYTNSHLNNMAYDYFQKSQNDISLNLDFNKEKIIQGPSLQQIYQKHTQQIQKKNSEILKLQSESKQLQDQVLQEREKRDHYEKEWGKLEKKLNQIVEMYESALQQKGGEENKLTLKNKEEINNLQDQNEILKQQITNLESEYLDEKKKKELEIEELKLQIEGSLDSVQRAAGMNNNLQNMLSNIQKDNLQLKNQLKSYSMSYTIQSEIPLESPNKSTITTTNKDLSLIQNKKLINVDQSLRINTSLSEEERRGKEANSSSESYLDIPCDLGLAFQEKESKLQEKLKTQEQIISELNQKNEQLESQISQINLQNQRKQQDKYQQKLYEEQEEENCTNENSNIFEGLNESIQILNNQKMELQEYFSEIQKMGRKNKDKYSSEDKENFDLNGMTHRSTQRSVNRKQQDSKVAQFEKSLNLFISQFRSIEKQIQKLQYQAGENIKHQQKEAGQQALIQQQFRETMGKLQNKFEKEVNKLKSKYESNLTKYEQEILRLQDQQFKDISFIKQQFQKKESALNDTIFQLKEEINIINKNNQQINGQKQQPNAQVSEAFKSSSSFISKNNSIYNVYNNKTKERCKTEKFSSILSNDITTAPQSYNSMNETQSLQQQFSNFQDPVKPSLKYQRGKSATNLTQKQVKNENLNYSFKASRQQVTQETNFKDLQSKTISSKGNKQEIQRGQQMTRYQSSINLRDNDMKLRSKTQHFQQFNQKQNKQDQLAFLTSRDGCDYSNGQKTSNKDNYNNLSQYQETLQPKFYTSRVLTNQDNYHQQYEQNFKKGICPSLTQQNTQKMNTFRDSHASLNNTQQQLNTKIKRSTTGSAYSAENISQLISNQYLGKIQLRSLSRNYNTGSNNSSYLHQQIYH